jgi:hypothetical protein
MSFKGEVKASLGWNWSEGAVDNDRLDYSGQLLLGNGENQAEAVWHVEQQTLLGGAAVDLDLSNLGRAILGDLHVVTLLGVKALLIVNEGAEGGTLLVGGAASEAWSAPFGAAGDRVAVPPQSALLLSNRGAGWPVDHSHRNLKLAAAGGEVVYSMAVVGTITAAGSGSGSGSGS